MRIQGGPKKVRRSYKIVFNYRTSRFLSLQLCAKQRSIIRHHVQCVSPGFEQLFQTLAPFAYACVNKALRKISPFLDYRIANFS